MNTSSDSLPAPDELAKVHSERLSALIAQRMASGACSFADYMNQVLYEPGLGYYMAGAQKFGASGDFITAPETSPLFGHSVAQACRSLFAEMPTRILEIGAGSGKLAESVIDALPDVEGLEYLILEPSAELQHRQQQYLQSCLSEPRYQCLHWLSTLPKDFSGVVLANEVMDALPVERIKVNGVVQQVCVESRDGQFAYCHQDAPSIVQAEYSRIQSELAEPLPEGYTTEFAMLLNAWIAALANSIDRAALLLIDYGYPRQEYFAAERTNGTLACYYQHHMHENAFVWPGLQDITAHVDFTRVAEQAAANDLELLGYTSQASFLLDNGLMDHLSQAMAQCKNDVEKLQLSQAVKKLTLPGEMGERFQVMALGKGVDIVPTGFSLQELSYRL